jgi:hypothetical protein
MICPTCFQESVYTLANSFYLLQQQTNAIKYENIRKYRLRILRDTDSRMKKEQHTALYIKSKINAH